MIPRVTAAWYERNFTVHVCFADGTEGDIDLADELYGESFEPLRTRSMFKTVTVHPEFHTLCWPNGADLAPGFVYEKVCKT